MAITPEQAKKITREERAQVRALEKKIDAEIVEGFSDERRAIVHVEGSGIKGRLLSEIKRIYEKAGWNVSYHSDQRDGDFLEFRTKKGGRDYGNYCSLDR